MAPLFFALGLTVPTALPWVCSPPWSCTLSTCMALSSKERDICPDWVSRKNGGSIIPTTCAVVAILVSVRDQFLLAFVLVQSQVSWLVALVWRSPTMAATQGEWKRGQLTMPLPTPIPSMEPRHGQYCPPSLSNYFSSPSLNFLPLPLPSPPTPFFSHLPLPTIIPPVKGKWLAFLTMNPFSSLSQG